MIKEINHLTLSCVAVSGKNVNQIIFFQYSACLAQVMAICKKMAS